MTSLAIRRRQSIRAMRTLIRKWPNAYQEASFDICTERESDRLPGTPVHFTTGYYGDVDECLAVDELRHLQLINKTNWDRLAKESEIRDRYRR